MDVQPTHLCDTQDVGRNMHVVASVSKVSWPRFRFCWEFNSWNNGISMNFLFTVQLKLSCYIVSCCSITYIKSPRNRPKITQASPGLSLCCILRERRVPWNTVAQNERSAANWPGRVLGLVEVPNCFGQGEWVVGRVGKIEERDVGE